MMKRIFPILLFYLLLSTGFCAYAFEDFALNALQESYPFDARLYECEETIISENERSFEYRWKHSEIVIFSVAVGKDHAVTITYNDEYSFEEYYDELKLVHGGLFSSWAIEEKSWFSNIIPAHWTLEQFRVPHYNKGWIPHYPLFAKPIEAHTHGLPDDEAISQEDALQKAKKWLLESNRMDATTLAEQSVDIYYYVDDPQTPQWVFRFSKQLITTEVWMNAYSGDIYNMTSDQVLAKAKEWLLANAPNRAQQLSNHFFTIYCLEHEALMSHVSTSCQTDCDCTPVWMIQFEVSANNYYTLLIDDKTGNIIFVEASNG